MPEVVGRRSTAEPGAAPTVKRPSRAKEAPAPPLSGIAQRRAAAKDDGNAGYLERRREILEAAARVFKSKGLQGASLGDIAAESGADRASLYYYVGSKEELFHEVVRGAAESNLAAARAIHDGEGTAPEKIRALMESLMESYAANYPILYVFVQENLSHVPPKHREWAADMRQVNRDYERIVVDLVEQGLRAGTLRSAAPAWVVAYGIMGMLGWTNRWFHPGESAATAAEIASAFADTVLTGLVAPTPVRKRKGA